MRQDPIKLALVASVRLFLETQVTVFQIDAVFGEQSKFHQSPLYSGDSISFRLKTLEYKTKTEFAWLSTMKLCGLICFCM